MVQIAPRTPVPTPSVRSYLILWINKKYSQVKSDENSDFKARIRKTLVTETLLLLLAIYPYRAEIRYADNELTYKSPIRKRVEIAIFCPLDIFKDHTRLIGRVKTIMSPTMLITPLLMRIISAE